MTHSESFAHRNPVLPFSLPVRATANPSILLRVRHTYPPGERSLALCSPSRFPLDPTGFVGLGRLDFRVGDTESL